MKTIEQALPAAPDRFQAGILPEAAAIDERILKAGPDWRWRRGGEGSPWYPTMGLFRQTGYGE